MRMLKLTSKDHGTIYLNASRIVVLLPETDDVPTIIGMSSSIIYQVKETAAQVLEMLDCIPIEPPAPE